MARGGLIGGLVGDLGVSDEPQPTAQDWSMDESDSQQQGFAGGPTPSSPAASPVDLQGTLNSLLNAGDGWYGPGQAAPLEGMQYTPGQGVTPSGQQAPLTLWNFNMPMPARGPQAGAGFEPMPQDFTFAQPAVQDPTDKGARYADYLKALQAIYDSDPRIATEYDALWGSEAGDYDISGLGEALTGLDTEFWGEAAPTVAPEIEAWIQKTFPRLDFDTRSQLVANIWDALNKHQNKIGGGKSLPSGDYVRSALDKIGPDAMRQIVSGNDWQSRMDDWLTQQNDNPYFEGEAPDQASIIKYATDMGFIEPTPQGASQSTPVTPGGIWVMPRAMGNMGEVLNRYGLSAQGAMQSGGWYWVPVQAGSEWDIAKVLSGEGAVSYATPNLMPEGRDNFGGLTPTQRAYQSWAYLHPDGGVWNEEDETEPAPEGYSGKELQYRVPRTGY